MAERANKSKTPESGTLCGICYHMFELGKDRRAPDASGFCPAGKRKVERLLPACDEFRQATMFICHSKGYWLTPQLCNKNNSDRDCYGCPYKQSINAWIKGNV